MDAGTLIGHPGLLPSVVYIAGYGRSGSTLLDTLLGNHPTMFGAGEVASFFETWPDGGRCSCGRGYAECAFWPNVVSRAQAAFPALKELSSEEITARTRRVESSFSPLSSGSPSDRQFYGDLWRAMLSAIQQESGKSIVVDSSKSSRAVSRRIWALSELVGAKVWVLHLVRDPRALMWSAVRGSNRLLEAGRPAALSGGVLRALVGWSLANASVHAARAQNPHLSFLQLRYEDLAGNPAHVLRGLGAFLDVDFEPVVERIAKQLPFDPGHGVGGNRMRRQGPIRIAVDEEWKQALPRYARVLASLSWPLASQYGYDVLRSSN